PNQFRAEERHPRGGEFFIAPDPPEVAREAELLPGAPAPALVEDGIVAHLHVEQHLRALGDSDVKASAPTPTPSPTGFARWITAKLSDMTCTSSGSTRVPQVIPITPVSAEW